MARIIRKYKIGNTSWDAQHFINGISRSRIKQEDSIVSERGKKKSLASWQFSHSGIGTSSDFGRNIFECQI